MSASAAVRAPAYRTVALWKACEYASLVAFTIAMPRLMQPELYGRFAALLSLIGLLNIAATLGAPNTLARFIPEYETRGESHRTRGLFTLILAMRVAVAGAVAVALAGTLPRLLPGATGAVAVAGAAAFLAVAVGSLCFHLLYALNQLGRALVHDALFRFALVVAVLALGGHRHLSGAALALAIVETGFLALGLSWVRRYVAPADARDLRSELPALLRFGFAFFVSTLLLIGVWRGGELAVLYLSGSTAEVAFYSIANAAALAVSSLIGQMIMLLVPTLTAQHSTGQSGQADRLLSLALKYLTIGAFVFVLLVTALGRPVVERVLGAAYLPVADNLRILGLGLLPVPLLRAALAVATVRKAQRQAVTMTATGLLVFLVLAALMVPAGASRGAALAAALAIAATALIGAWQFSMAPLLRHARLVPITVFGALATGLAWTSALPPLAVTALATALFTGLLLASRVIGRDDLARLAGVAAGRPAPTVPES